MSAKLVIRGSALFVSLAAIGLALKAAGLIDVIDEAWVDATIRGRGLSGYLIFLAVGWGLTSVGLPRQLVAFLAGYAFGFVLGTGLSLAATVMGCVTAFTFARLFGRDLVARRISGRIKRVENFLSDNPFSMTLLIRFLPLGSNFLTNLAAGVSGVRALPFFLGLGAGLHPANDGIRAGRQRHHAGAWTPHQPQRRSVPGFGCHRHRPLPQIPPRQELR